MFGVELSECNGICFKTGILEHNQTLPRCNVTFSFEVLNAWVFQFLSIFLNYTQLSFKLMLYNTEKSLACEISSDDSAGKKMTVWST